MYLKGRDHLKKRVRQEKLPRDAETSGNNI